MGTPWRRRLPSYARSCPAVTPVVALVMPYSQATVLGTSLLAMVPPSAAALLQHHRWAGVRVGKAAYGGGAGGQGS